MASTPVLSQVEALTLLSSRITARARPLAASQIRTVPSQPPEASQLLSGATATADTTRVWPVRVARCCPLATSQIRTRPSWLPAASQLPSGATATAYTQLVWLLALWTARAA